MCLRITLIKSSMSLTKHTIIKSTGQRYSIYEYCRGIWRTDDLVFIFIVQDYLVALNNRVINGSNVYGFQYKEDSISKMFERAKISVRKEGSISVFPIIEKHTTN